MGQAGGHAGVGLPDFQAVDEIARGVEPAAAEHDHPRIVQPSQQRQRSDGVAKDVSLARFVEKSPHHHAGVVSVAEDHTGQRTVHSLGELRRILQHPRGVALFVDHQSNLVAQVELKALRHGRDEADAVEAHRLQIEQIAPQQVGIVRHPDGAGDVGAGVRTAPEHAAAVQPKVTVLEAKIAKTESRRRFR